MRTTVTLDADTAQMIRVRMAEQHISFKRALNDAIRAGARQGGRPIPFVTRTASMGQATVNLDHALRVAGDLEDEELVRRMRRRA